MDFEATSLLDGDGREKYLSGEEITRAIKASEFLRPKPRAYFLTLFNTGARRSEALALRRRDIDMEKGRVAILTLKQKRGKGKQPKPSWRRVPVTATRSRA